MDAAKARPQASGRAWLSLVIDRPEVLEATKVRRPGRRDLAVELELPVHALGDRLDHQVAVLEQIQMLLVIGLPDQRGVFCQAQGRGLELFQAPRWRALLWRLAAPSASPLGQVEQQHRHFDIDEVSGNLRTHHPGAEHGDLPDME
jgi:hypothetical protein